MFSLSNGGKDIKIDELENELTFADLTYLLHFTVIRIKFYAILDIKCDKCQRVMFAVYYIK